MTPPQGFQGHPGPPEGSGDAPECIFVITEVCGTTLLNNIFPYHQLLKCTPECPGYPGGQGLNLNSLFRAPIDIGFDLQSTFFAKMSSFLYYLDVTWLQTEINS